MLKNTFQHIPGIGGKTEERLWAAGVNDWDCLGSAQGLSLPSKRMAILKAYCRESREQFARGNPAYFEALLSASLGWRLFPEFRDRAVYLDIETDGLDSYYGHITTIALYDGSDIFWYVKGKNLDDFITDIAKYQVIVTYNGKTFDIPFIQSYFRIKLTQAHIDLRYVLASLGYKGGLKHCEKSLGVGRGDLAGIDGSFAPLLWKEYQIRNSRAALETLLAYNIEDVVNLETLLVKAYNLKIALTPFAKTHRIELPRAPELPFKPHRQVVEKIQARVFAASAYGY
ncbi:MAG: ribonuclease H-like domain-containing protein [Desulfobacterales bacterium]|nr:ribonuclease H-like domain-containing protein [Desulfobacterales bacterium]